LAPLKTVSGRHRLVHLGIQTFLRRRLPTEYCHALRRKDGRNPGL
jgi:hypothetical protein